MGICKYGCRVLLKVHRASELDQVMKMVSFLFIKKRRRIYWFPFSAPRNVFDIFLSGDDKMPKTRAKAIYHDDINEGDIAETQMGYGTTVDNHSSHSQSLGVQQMRVKKNAY